MFHHAMRGDTLSLLHWNHVYIYIWLNDSWWSDDHLVWPIHVPRRCEPLITPHLSLWGNARTRATFPTHKKSHYPHPQGEEGEGGQDGHITLGGGGGGPATPGSYILHKFFDMVYGFWLLRLQVEAQNHHGENLINSSVAATPVKFGSKQMVLGMDLGWFGQQKCFWGKTNVCLLTITVCFATVFFWGEGGASLFLVGDMLIWMFFSPSWTADRCMIPLR